MTRLLALFLVIAQTGVMVWSFSLPRQRANPFMLQMMIRGDPNGLQQPMETRQTIDGLKTNLAPTTTSFSDNQRRRYETARFFEEFGPPEQRRYDNWYYSELENRPFVSRGLFEDPRRPPFRNGNRYPNELLNRSPQQQRPFPSTRQPRQISSPQQRQRYDGRRPDDESFFRRRRPLEPYYNPRETSFWIRANPQRPTPLMPNEARYDATYEKQTRYEVYQDGRGAGAFVASMNTQQPWPRRGSVPPPRRPLPEPPGRFDPRHPGRRMSNGATAATGKTLIPFRGRFEGGYQFFNSPRSNEPRRYDSARTNPPRRPIPPQQQQTYNHFNGPRTDRATTNPQRMTQPQYRGQRPLSPAPAYRPFSNNGNQVTNNRDNGSMSMNQQRRFQQQHYLERERESQFNNRLGGNGSMNQRRPFAQQRVYQEGQSPPIPPNNYGQLKGGSGGIGSGQQRRFPMQHYLEREKSSLAPPDQFNNGSMINDQQSNGSSSSSTVPSRGKVSYRGDNGSLPQFGSSDDRKAVTMQVLTSINRERERQRMRPLQLDPYLSRAAQQGVELFRRDGKIDYSNGALKRRVKATGYDNMDANKIDSSTWKSWFTEIHVQGTDTEKMVQSLLTGRFRQSLLSFQDVGIAYDGNVLVITLGSIEFREKKPFTPEQRMNFANEVFRLTNVERNKNGLRPFVRNLKLDQAARLHAQDMYERGFYSHRTPEGESELQRIERTGYLNIDTIGAAHWTTATAENIAKGQQSPKEVVQDWMESPDHRKNILSKEYEDLGVGVHGEHWVQNFGIKFVEYDAAYRDALKQLVESSQQQMPSAQTVPRGTLPEEISSTDTSTGRTRT